MNHYAILGCADTLVGMIFEILSTKHDDQVSVDIIKNIVLDGTRHPNQTEGIVSREIYAEDWQKREGIKAIMGVVKPASKVLVREYFAKQFSVSDSDTHNAFLSQCYNLLYAGYCHKAWGGVFRTFFRPSPFFLTGIYIVAHDCSVTSPTKMCNTDPINYDG